MFWKENLERHQNQKELAFWLRNLTVISFNLLDVEVTEPAIILLLPVFLPIASIEFALPLHLPEKAAKT